MTRNPQHQAHLYQHLVDTTFAYMFTKIATMLLHTFQKESTQNFYSNKWTSKLSEQADPSSSHSISVLMSVPRITSCKHTSTVNSLSCKIWDVFHKVSTTIWSEHFFFFLLVFGNYQLETQSLESWHEQFLNASPQSGYSHSVQCTVYWYALIQPNRPRLDPWTF